MSGDITAFVIPHTHWDREWYLPFQQFRARLVEVLDGVLDLLERRDDFPCFTLDGQAVLLEDYLELRPERRADIERLVRAGRLHIGPWYVLADEFLVSPEALVRNLLLGRQVCAPFGGAMEVGYTPDPFGHIAQLPLLLAEFGIDSVVFERGVGDEGERLRAEFDWIGADGKSRVFAVHLLGTYSAVAALGHRDWELTDRFDEEQAVRHLRLALYGPDPDRDPPDIPVWLLTSLERIDGGVCAYTRSAALPLLNGSDHLYAQTDLPEALARVADAFPDIRFEHGHLAAFVAAARASAPPLECYQGEFRGSRYHHVLSGTLSTRLPLKRMNDRVETLLERYTEPLALRGWLAGGNYRQAVLAQAWRLLLRNHPHDSICGCSTDEVHREMGVRFEGAWQLGTLLAEGGVAALASADPERAAATHSVFNPSPYERHALVEVIVDTPEGEGALLRAGTPDGRSLPSEGFVERLPAPGRSDTMLDRVRLRLLLPLAPLSLTPLRIAPERNGSSTSPVADTSAVRTTRSDGAVVLENRHLRARLGPDGALLLEDLATGTRLPLRLLLEEGADAGDSYDHSPLPGGAAQRIAPTGLELAEAGGLRACAKFVYRAVVPARLAQDRSSRVGEVPFDLHLEAVLEAEGRALLLRATFDNRAEDHRLRLLIDSDIEADTVWAGGHFATLERPLRPPAGVGWFQAPQGTSHMRHLLLVGDGARSLALLSRGLPEYEALRGERGVTLAPTLVRSVGWLSRDDLRSRPQGAGPALPVPEAQCLGRHEIDLALLPLSGAPWQGPLAETLDAFVAPPRVFAQPAAGGPLLELTPPLLLSACKRAEAGEGCIVRVWNPAPEPVEGILKVGVPLRAAYRVTLSEDRIEEVPAHSTQSLRLDPNEVRTLEFDLRKGVVASSQEVRPTEHVPRPNA